MRNLIFTRKAKLIQSNLAFIEPVRFRLVASGLIIDKVFSIVILFSKKELSICIGKKNQCLLKKD